MPDGAITQRAHATTHESTDARDQLETALTAICGAAHALMAIGSALPAESEAVSYLGSQVYDHQQAAHDAFRQIFKLDEYNEHLASDRQPQS